MGEIDDEVAEVQAVIDGLRARLEVALAEVGKARVDPTGPGHHKARRWARGEERRYTLRWLRSHGNLNAAEAADSIEAGDHRPEGRHGVPTATEWTDLEARAKAAEAALAQARAEGEAVGYRRAIDDACAVLDARHDAIAARGTESPYDDGKLDALDTAERAVRKLAPVEPVSKADELPAGGAS